MKAKPTRTSGKRRTNGGRKSASTKTVSEKSKIYYENTLDALDDEYWVITITSRYDQPLAELRVRPLPPPPPRLPIDWPPWIGGASVL